MSVSTERDRTYTLSMKTGAITDPLSIWLIFFFIPENEGIIHMSVSNSLDLCVPPLHLSLLERMVLALAKGMY